MTTWSCRDCVLSAGQGSLPDGCRMAVRRVQEVCHGTFNVARGDPVRAGNDPGQALPGHREQLDRLQPAPRQLPEPNPDEDLLPVPRRGGATLRDGPRLRVE